MTDREVRLRRLKMRSMRRGIKEMDLILSRFAETEIAGMTDAELDQYEAMLEIGDQELFTWMNGQVAPDPNFAWMVGRIRSTFGIKKT